LAVGNAPLWTVTAASVLSSGEPIESSRAALRSAQCHGRAALLLAPAAVIIGGPANRQFPPFRRRRDEAALLAGG